MSFQVQVGSNIGFFWVKIDHDGRLPYQTNNPPGNWIMGPTKHTPSIQVSFQVQVGPKMGVLGVKNSQNDRMQY